MEIDQPCLNNQLNSGKSPNKPSLVLFSSVKEGNYTVSGIEADFQTKRGANVERKLKNTSCLTY